MLQEIKGENGPFGRIAYCCFGTWFVMSNYCKYNLPEISRLLSHADLDTVELSRTFYQVTYLLCKINTTKIALMLASGMFQNTL